MSLWTNSKHVSCRLRIEEARVEEEEKKEHEHRKKARQVRKDWHEQRNQRFDAWKGFSKSVRVNLLLDVFVGGRECARACVVSYHAWGHSFIVQA
jgi:hypothetical protein